MAPSAVALAVLPPAASVADLQRRDADTVWPTHGWAVSTPESQGVDTGVLASAMATIRARHLPVHSLLIARHGKIVLDAYFHPFADNQLHDVASVTKSVVSTLVGIAMRQRRIGDLNTPVMQMLPSEAAADPWKSRMTLAHMLSMTSGLDCSGNGSRNFLQQMEQSPHWTEFALGRQLVAQPGTTFAYCAGNMQVVSAVLTGAVGESAAAFARQELFAPLGIDHVAWATDRDGISHGFSDLRMQPRDMAKLGYLWLHHGVWEGRQIVPASYLAAAFSRHANVEANVQYGYGMWIYPARGHAGGAPDFEANGYGGQRIAVIPGEDMVVVITGAGLDANDVGRLIADAARAAGPLPANPQGAWRLNTLVADAAGSSRARMAKVEPKLRGHRAAMRTAALGVSYH
jgi:CubicO group peptidase (beta-lactamase class C family)